LERLASAPPNRTLMCIAAEIGQQRVQSARVLDEVTSRLAAAAQGEDPAEKQLARANAHSMSDATRDLDQWQASLYGLWLANEGDNGPRSLLDLAVRAPSLPRAPVFFAATLMMHIALRFTPRQEQALADAMQELEATWQPVDVRPEARTHRTRLIDE